jgi:hypothetical protein
VSTFYNAPMWGHWLDLVAGKYGSSTEATGPAALRGEAGVQAASNAAQDVAIAEAKKQMAAPPIPFAQTAPAGQPQGAIPIPVNNGPDADQQLRTMGVIPIPRTVGERQQVNDNTIRQITAANAASGSPEAAGAGLGQYISNRPGEFYDLGGIGSPVMPGAPIGEDIAPQLEGGPSAQARQIRLEADRMGKGPIVSGVTQGADGSWDASGATVNPKGKDANLTKPGFFKSMALAALDTLQRGDGPIVGALRAGTGQMQEGFDAQREGKIAQGVYENDAYAAEQAKRAASLGEIQSRTYENVQQGNKAARGTTGRVDPAEEGGRFHIQQYLNAIRQHRENGLPIPPEWIEALPPEYRPLAGGGPIPDWQHGTLPTGQIVRWDENDATKREMITTQGKPPEGPSEADRTAQARAAALQYVQTPEGRRDAEARVWSQMALQHGVSSQEEFEQRIAGLESQINAKLQGINKNLGEEVPAEVITWRDQIQALMAARENLYKGVIDQLANDRAVMTRSGMPPPVATPNFTDGAGTRGRTGMIPGPVRMTPPVPPAPRDPFER